MKILIVLATFLCGQIALADSPKIGVTYSLVDKFCSDGSELLDKPAADLKGQMTLRFSETMMVVSHKKFPGQDLKVRYWIDGNKIVNLATDGKTVVNGTIRTTEEMFVWITELPSGKFAAARVCAGGTSVVSLFEELN